MRPCRRLLIKRPVVRSGSRPCRHMVSLCLHDDPSPSCFLSNEVVLSRGCVIVSWSCRSSSSSDLLLNFICLSTSGSTCHGHMTQSQEVLITRVLFPPDLATGSQCSVASSRTVYPLLLWVIRRWSLASADTDVANQRALNWTATGVVPSRTLQCPLSMECRSDHVLTTWLRQDTPPPTGVNREMLVSVRRRVM